MPFPRRHREQLMSSFSEQDPNDPEFYAPLRLRERAAKLGPSVSQEARSEPIGSSPISLPASRDNALWKPLDPQVINEPARRAWERRTAQLSIAAAAAGVATVVVLLFVLMMPASRQSVASSTSSEITGSTSTAPRQPIQADVGSKPALAEFEAFLSSSSGPPSQPSNSQPATSQPAAHEQQSLEQFLQWRKKANTIDKTVE